MRRTLAGLLYASIDGLRKDKARLVFLSLYLVFTLFSTVYFAVLGHARNALLPIPYAALFIVGLFVFEYFLSMRCPLPFLLILFFVPIGGILGTCYNVYTLIPVFDTVLHTLSGFIFAALGYSLMNRILMKSDGKTLLASLLFAFAFSLAIAVLWEMFEWLLTALMNGDMQEDGLVKDIFSYFPTGSHNEVFEILDIEKTEIYYSGGQIYTVEGGYLDLGLFDTLLDMLVCLMGDAVFALLGAISILSRRNMLCSLTPTPTGIG